MPDLKLCSKLWDQQIFIHDTSAVDRCILPAHGSAAEDMVAGGNDKQELTPYTCLPDPLIAQKQQSVEYQCLAGMLCPADAPSLGTKISMGAGPHYLSLEPPENCCEQPFVDAGRGRACCG